MSILGIQQAFIIRFRAADFNILTAENLAYLAIHRMDNFGIFATRWVTRSMR
jgi:hypothetical protein